MAGYFSKLNGRVYAGEYPAANDIENGTFAVINSSGKVVPSGTNTNVELSLVEKLDMWGKPAFRLNVVKEDGSVYMVEGDFDVYEYDEYDETLFTVKKDKLVKMRVPHISDEIILIVNNTLYNAGTVGDHYTIASSGTIAKVAG